jgi:hypothetical protein
MDTTNLTRSGNGDLIVGSRSEPTRGAPSAAPERVRHGVALLRTIQKRYRFCPQIMVAVGAMTGYDSLTSSTT